MHVSTIKRTKATTGNLLAKRIVDLFFAVMGLVLLSGVMLLAYVVASIDTQSNGLFIQKRIGQYGRSFSIFKLKTIHPKTRRISATGRFLRKSKLDELPQFLNVLLGDMSFVGPRPDIAGYYDLLQGEERNVLELKPGLTSLASIKYANEEDVLVKQDDPLQYNDHVIFPDKVKMNLDYYYNRSLWGDLRIIWRTVFR